MAGPAQYLPRLAAVLTLFAGIFAACPARAEVHVSIQVDSEERLALAQRLASELQSEGYAVELTAVAETSPCEADGARLGTVTRDTKAWVR